jgi:hypothetical protein
MADDPLEEEALARLEEARRHKAQWALDFKEGYYFSAPQRQRDINSNSHSADIKSQDAGELNTDLGFILVGDFVTEVANTFMPEAQSWCERGRGMFVSEGPWNKVKDKVRQQDDQIFEAMKASNLYPEIAKAWAPDLALGTAGLWIEHKRPHEPICVSAVPLREMDLNLGPNGDLDDRFVTRHTRNLHLKALLPDIDLPQEVLEEIEKNPGKKTEVVWGFWRLWEETYEVWKHVILVKKKIVHRARLEGEGSCPFIPHRFNPCADFPFGMGPLIQCLPSFRQVDELELGLIENVDLHLRPPIAYPDDSIAGIESGLESGQAYPVRPGSESAIKPIFQATAPDAAVYQYEQKESRMRKLFFIDLPQQRGDTPPTLGQWLDELARAQRRIGTPGLSFWREGPAQFFLRFKYLLEKQGAIDPVTVDGAQVSTRAMNPAQRAAEQQEIATAFQFLQMMFQTFPEESRMVIDGQETISAFMDKMRIRLVKIRSADKVKAAIAHIQSLMGSQGAGIGAAQTKALPPPGPA